MSAKDYKGKSELKDDTACADPLWCAMFQKVLLSGNQHLGQVGSLGAVAAAVLGLSGWLLLSLGLVAGTCR